MANQTQHFAQLAAQVQKAPQAQRTRTLIEGIANQMQQSGNPEAQQLGSELKARETELANACQQQG